MTSDEARDWLRLFNDLPEELRYECQHGHAACSITSKGECLDEVLEVLHRIPPGLLTPPARAWLTLTEVLNDVVWVKGSIPPGYRNTIRTKLPVVVWRSLQEDGPAPLLLAQRLAAEKARREMDDNEEGC